MERWGGGCPVCVIGIYMKLVIAKSKHRTHIHYEASDVLVIQCIGSMYYVCICVCLYDCRHIVQYTALKILPNISDVTI